MEKLSIFYREHLSNAPKVIGAPAIIHASIKLSGFVNAFVRRANCPDVNELVFEDENLIDSSLKEFFRNEMNSDSDFALDNLRAVQSPTGTNGDDGIIIYDNDIPGTGGAIIGIMASVVHPSDPSGNYYRRWQGVWQEPSASETVKSAMLMHSMLGETSLSKYATEDISPDISLVLNDVLTINWKVSVG